VVDGLRFPSQVFGRYRDIFSGSAVVKEVDQAVDLVAHDPSRAGVASGDDDARDLV
jgi:hypothetical protein